MTHLRSRLLFATTLASLALASVLQAQGAPPRPRDPQGATVGMRRNAGQPAGAMRRDLRAGNQGVGAARGARGGRANPAAMLLRLRAALELTDDQVKRLEALRDTPAPARNAADMLRARADLLEANQGDGNLTKARAALDRLSTLRNERLIAGLKQRQDARAVLTAQQKARLDNLRAARRGAGWARGRGMRPGMGAGLRAGAGGRQGMQRPGAAGPGMIGRGMIGRGMRRRLLNGLPPATPVPPAPRPPEDTAPPQ